MAFFMAGDPEDLRAAVDRQHMEMESIAHQISSLWETLDKDQMTAVQHLLRILHNAGEQSPRIAGYYLGVAAGVSSGRFGFCLACGTDHSAQLNDLNGGGNGL